MSCPFDYSLCDQTVTLYRRRGQEISRQVVKNAHFSYQAQQVTDQFGTRQETAFELIVPGEIDLQPGDRVYDGIGPETVDWNSFLPVTVAGLAQVQYVKPCFWQGEVCHTVAGRK